MITLENISKMNNVVKANYYIESDSDDMGYLEYDLFFKRILKHEYSKRDSELLNRPGISRAVKAIEYLAQSGIFPRKYKYMWY